MKNGARQHRAPYPYASIATTRTCEQEKQCRRAKPSGIFFDWLPPFSGTIRYGVVPA